MKQKRIEQVNLTRLEIFIPLNENVLEDYQDLIDSLIYKFEQGCTYSRRMFPSYFQGIWWNHKKNKPDPPEDVALIIFGLDVGQRKSLPKDIRMVLKNIEKLGEKEPWVTASGMVRYLFELNRKKQNTR